MIVESPIIDDINNFKGCKSLYKEINQQGYKLFSLSLNTINLIKLYGPENISKNLELLNIIPAEVIKGVNFNNIKGNSFYDKTRKALTFYRIAELEKLDLPLYTVIVAISNDIKKISELNKWFSNDFDDMWNMCLFITMNFLISTKCSPNVKSQNNGVQDYHIDFPVIQKFKEDGITKNEYYDINYPLSVIIALEDNTYFRFLCQSHNKYDDNNEPNKDFYNSKLLNLSAGNIIIFHPNLIHSGKLLTRYILNN